MNFKFFRWTPINQFMMVELAECALPWLLVVLSFLIQINSRLMFHDCTLASAINIYLIKWLLSPDDILLKIHLIESLNPTESKVIILHFKSKVRHSDSLSILVFDAKVILVEIIEAVGLRRVLRLVSSGDQVSVFVVRGLKAADSAEGASICLVVKLE